MTDETRTAVVELLKQAASGEASGLYEAAQAVYGATSDTLLQEPGAVVYSIARDARSFCESLRRSTSYEETCLHAADMVERKAWP